MRCPAFAPVLAPGLGLAVLALFVSTPARAQIQTIGAELRANTNEDFHQRHPVSLIAADGSTTVIWENEETGLRAQRFDPQGRRIGTEIQLVSNVRLTGDFAIGPVVYASRPTAAALPNGDFILAWVEERAVLHLSPFQQWKEISSREIVGRRFNALGAPRGTRFGISNGAGALADRPQAVWAGQRRVLVTWESDDRNDSTSLADGVFARIVNADGSAHTGIVRVNAGTDASALRPAVARSTEGRYLVTWEGCCEDGSDKSVSARLLNASASPLGAPFRINTSTVGPQRRPAVSASTSGDFLVVWQGRGATNQEAHIFAQVVSRTGGLIGSEKRVSSGEQGGNAQIAPAVAVDGTGGYLVTWLDWAINFPIGVFGARLDAAANASGESRLSEHQVGAQHEHHLATNGRGNVVAVYESFLADEIGIAGRRLASGGNRPESGLGLTP